MHITHCLPGSPGISCTTQGSSIISFVGIHVEPSPAQPSRPIMATQAHQELELISHSLFTDGLSEGTRRSYLSARRRYASFCGDMQLQPLPLSEYHCCLFVSFLTTQGLTAQSVLSYLAAVRHWHIEAGFGTPPTSQWPRLHYVLRGIKRNYAGSPRRARLPITPNILLALLRVWVEGQLEPEFDARLLWAACCTCYFGFFRAGELTTGLAEWCHIAPSPHKRRGR